MRGSRFTRKRNDIVPFLFAKQVAHWHGIILLDCLNASTWYKMIKIK